MKYEVGERVWIVQEPYKVLIIRVDDDQYLVRTSDGTEYWVNERDIVSN